jgi:large subunit ribosomal protein L10
MANVRNQQTLAELRQSLESRSSFFLVNYQGLTAQGLGDLRKTLRKEGAQLLVAKNTLINIALQDKGFDFSESLTGPTALVVVGSDDPVSPVKTLVEYAKKNDKGIPAAKGGVLDGAKIGPERFEAIANLPSKDVLRAELLGVLQSVASDLVGTLQGKLQEFVGILDAKVQQAEGN